MSVRYFPYYNDEYLGVSEFGYSSVNSAKRQMRIYWNDVMNHFNVDEDEYDRKYSYICPADLEHHGYGEKINYSSGGWIYRDKDEKVYIKDIADDDFLEKLYEFIEFKKNCKIIPVKEIKEFQEKYGYTPSIYLDEREYNRLRRKFIKEAVTIVEKEVNLL